MILKRDALMKQLAKAYRVAQVLITPVVASLNDVRRHRRHHCHTLLHFLLRPTSALRAMRLRHATKLRDAFFMDAECQRQFLGQAPLAVALVSFSS